MENLFILTLVFINLVYNVIISQIQHKRIKDLKDKLDEQGNMFH